jgi:hypothetical protein
MTTPQIMRSAIRAATRYEYLFMAAIGESR